MSQGEIVLCQVITHNQGQEMTLPSDTLSFPPIPFWKTFQIEEQKAANCAVFWIKDDIKRSLGWH